MGYGFGIDVRFFLDFEHHLKKYLLEIIYIYIYPQYLDDAQSGHQPQPLAALNHPPTSRLIPVSKWLNSPQWLKMLQVHDMVVP